MKPIIITSALSLFLLSGCDTMNDYEKGMPQSNQATAPANNQLVTTKHHKKPRQHFVRGEQVGDELPFTAGESKENATVDKN